MFAGKMLAFPMTARPDINVRC